MRDNPSLVDLAVMDELLKEQLTMWHSDGFLRFQEISWSTAASTLEYVNNCD